MRNKNLLGLVFVIGIGILIMVFFHNNSSNDTVEIQDVLQKEVPNKSGVKSFEVVDLIVKDNFARATIKPLDVVTDNAFVILQKKDGIWEIIWGPGTALIPEDPIYRNLPREVLP